LENTELIKYANNAFLATKVSFVNTIANIAERTPNADVQTIARGIGLDERIGSRFLNAGLGWGRLMLFQGSESAREVQQESEL